MDRLVHFAKFGIAWAIITGFVGCHAIPWLGFFDRVARAITSFDAGYPSDLICLADNSCGSYCCALGVEPTSHVSEALERRNHAR